MKHLTIRQYEQEFAEEESPREYQPPIVTELEAVLDELPAEPLLQALRGPKRRGRKGYRPELLFRCFVAFYLLGLDSVAALVRTLEDNPFISAACYVDYRSQIPSEATFSRFAAKLAKPAYTLLLKNVSRALMLVLYTRLPGFGENVAIDSTDIRAWSNSGKTRKGKHSDEDAGWLIKRGTDGRDKVAWAFKAHVLADCRYELPIVSDISPGNLHDIHKATPLLRQARFAHTGFRPAHILCDKGYSSKKLRRAIRQQYQSRPIIDFHPTHKKAIETEQPDDEWWALYQKRQGIERLFGRMKGFRRLNSLRWRGRAKVRIHVLLAVIVTQARALAVPEQIRGAVRPA